MLGGERGAVSEDAPMSPDDADEAEFELEQLLERRGRRDGAHAREARIAELAAALGLDPEELAEIGPVELQAEKARDRMVGDFRVLRRFRDVAFLPWGLVVAAIVVGLGEPVVGIAAGAAVILLFVVRAVRRVARFTIDETGTFTVPSHLEPLDWSTLSTIDFAYRYPRFTSDRGIDRAAGVTMDLRLHLADGRRVKFARGALYRKRPTRSVVGIHNLERWLKARARAAGMKVERTSNESWTAQRR